MHNHTRLNRGLAKISTKLFLARKMAYCGKKTVLFHPMRLDWPGSMCLEDGVFIGEGAWLLGAAGDKVTLSIGSGTTIGHYSHIVATHDVRIGNNVLIADKVFISDCTHEFSNPDIPVADQPVKPIRPVAVGDGSWIGESVAIMGASIGKHCVVGANSVVNRDVPDYTVVGGVPARPISRYSFELKEWVSCKND